MTSVLNALKTLATSALIAVASISAPGPAATQERPLLAEGRETVFQRVLTRPGAELHESMGASANRSYPAFQPLYVYAREPGWIRVGRSISGRPEGWIQAGDVIPWRHNIVGSFTNTAGRERSIMFESDEKLRWLLNHEALRAIQPQLISDADNENLDPERGILAVEPREFIDIGERFYLMPILDFVQDFHPETYEPNLHMKVATIPLEDRGDQEVTGDLDAGIIFVFDTTQSMDPFIASTQRAVEQIVRRIQGTDVGVRTNFGVVAFRDNVDAAPGLEYRTRLLLPLERRSDQTPVLATIRAATSVSAVSSPGFNEDSIAGLEDAINLTDWTASGTDPFDVRIVILITDAGPKAPSDPNARSEIGVDELRIQAELENIVLMTLHLKTSSGGEAQHAYAEREYRKMTRFFGNEYYYDIPDGSDVALGAEVQELVTSIIDIVRISEGQDPEIAPEDTRPEMRDLGLALRLAYLGAVEGTQAPSVVESWVSEKALEDSRLLAIQPRLLVTRNEMATMYDLLTGLFDDAARGGNSNEGDAFFAQVRDVVGRMAQNPDRLVFTEAETLGGALEFLEDLPYNSQFMDMTPELWEQSAMRRRQLEDNLRRKNVQYGKWLRNPSVWTALYEAAPDGEHVFAMPFEMLP